MYALLTAISTIFYIRFVIIYTLHNVLQDRCMLFYCPSFITAVVSLYQSSDPQKLLQLQGV